MLAVVNIFVNSLLDSSGNAAYCQMANLGLQKCNLRSAWELCSSLSSTSADEDCAIHLPEKSLIQLNASYGEFILPPDGNIRIIGNDATIQGMGEYEKELVIDRQFIIAKNLNKTSSATQRYVERCLDACPGDNLFFSSCGNAVGDTYFRLYRDNIFVDSNDDKCGLVSELSYTVPKNTPCGSYCLRVGCYASTTCTQTVYMKHIKIEKLIEHRFLTYGSKPKPPKDPSEYTPNFHMPSDLHSDDQFDDDDPSHQHHDDDTYYYFDDNRDDDYGYDDDDDYGYDDDWDDDYGAYSFNYSPPSNDPATLELFDMKIQDFGSDIGGVIRSVGTLNLYIHGVHLSSTFAIEEGGAFYFSQSSQDSNFLHLIENCTFSDNDASVGGALYYSSPLHMTIKNSLFVNSTALYGGGIYMIGAQHMDLQNTQFLNCFADTGGGIFFGKNSKLGILQNLNFHSCSSTNGGSGLYMYKSSDIDFHHLTCDKSVSDGLGDGLGGCVWIQESSDLTFNRSIFSSSSAKQGGCLYLQQGQNILFFGNQFHFCASAKNGGALAIVQSFLISLKWNFISHSTAVNGGGLSIDNSRDNKIDHLIIQYSTATSFGGGMYVLDDQHLRVTNSTIIGSRSKVGGGLYVETSKAPHFQVEILQCVSLDVGGGVTIESSSHPVILDSLLDSNIASRSGGGLYLKSKNTNAKLVSSVISNNIAPIGGGTTVYSANDFPLFLDKSGYKQAFTLHSPNPAPSGNTYSSHHTSDCIGYLIAFDERTTLGEADLLEVSSQQGSASSGYTTRGYFSYSEGENFPGVDTPMLWVEGQKLEIKLSVSSSHRDALFGYVAYVYPLFERPTHRLIFKNNVATNRGGGLAFGYSNSYPILFNVEFTNNSAINGGGGAYMNANTNGGYFGHTNFIANHVPNGPGGGLLVAALASALTIRRCLFQKNVALDGGGMYTAYQNGVGGMETGNEITLIESSFQNNQAASGGAFYFEFNNIIVLENLVVTNNSAMDGSGGAMMVESQNSIIIRESLFQHNYASQRGAAINTIETNIIYVEWSDFLNNAVDGLGGAISIQNYTSLSFSGKINFKDNSAKYAGGGIASIRCPMWKLASHSTNLLFVENDANWGSALFFHAFLEGSSVLENVTMRSNVARVSGTLYWIYDAEMRSEVPGLHSQSVIFEHNRASFGNVVSTQPTMIFTPPTTHVNSFDSPINPPIEVIWKDFYGQTVLSPLTTTSISVKILDDMNHPIQCLKQKPALEGQDMISNHVKFGRNGSAFFNYLLPTCVPGGNMSIHFTAELGNLYLPSLPSRYYIENTTRLMFRQCHRGEYFSNGQCVVCERGSFSFRANDKRQCQDCSKIEGIETCQGDQIILMPGYWRRLPDSTAVFSCPMVLGSCKGGNETGDHLCSAGYTGPLCSVCSPGYFQSDVMCLPCSGESLFTPLLLIYFLIAVILVGVGLFLVFFRKRILAKIESRQQQLDQFMRKRGGSNPLELNSLHRINGADRQSPFSIRQSAIDDHHSRRRAEDEESEMSKDDKASAASDEIEAQLIPTKVEFIFMWLRTNWETIVVKSKIIVATYQVVVGIGDVVSVKFPSSFVSFTDTFSFFHLNIWNALPLGCSMHISFIDKLILITLAPIALTSIFWMCFVVEYLYHTTKKVSRADISRIYGELKDRYSNLLFYLSYLILPSVTSTIFETFLCENIDPNDEDSSTNDYYLQAS